MGPNARARSLPLTRSGSSPSAPPMRKASSAVPPSRQRASFWAKAAVSREGRAGAEGRGFAAAAEGWRGERGRYDRLSGSAGREGLLNKRKGVFAQLRRSAPGGWKMGEMNWGSYNRIGPQRKSIR